MPDNTTITSITGTTSVTFPGIALEITNPNYQKWKLIDQTVQSVPVNPGIPLNNITSIQGKEIIFVDLNSHSDSWSRYKSNTSTTTTNNSDDYENDLYWANEGNRYEIPLAEGQNEPVAVQIPLKTRTNKSSRLLDKISPCSASQKN